MEGPDTFQHFSRAAGVVNQNFFFWIKVVVIAA